MAKVDSSVLTHGNILLCIFDYLSFDDIVTCSQVSKFWHQTALNEKLWLGKRGTIKIIILSWWGEARSSLKATYEQKKQMIALRNDVVNVSIYLSS